MEKGDNGNEFISKKTPKNIVFINEQPILHVSILKLGNKALFSNYRTIIICCTLLFEVLGMNKLQPYHKLSQ